MPERSVMDAILAQGGSEEVQIIREVFPSDYNKKKQMSEIAPEIMSVSVVLGTVQRTFGSKRLKIFDDELLSRMKSKDRKGEMAIIEVLLGMARSRQESPID